VIDPITYNLRLARAKAVHANVEKFLGAAPRTRLQAALGNLEALGGFKSVCVVRDRIVCHTDSGIPMIMRAPQ
jgi:hypothetical protein